MIKNIYCFLKIYQKFINCDSASWCFLQGEGATRHHLHIISMYINVKIGEH